MPSNMPSRFRFENAIFEHRRSIGAIFGRTCSRSTTNSVPSASCIECAAPIADFRSSARARRVHFIFFRASRERAGGARRWGVALPHSGGQVFAENPSGPPMRHFSAIRSHSPIRHFAAPARRSAERRGRRKGRVATLGRPVGAVVEDLARRHLGVLRCSEEVRALGDDPRQVPVSPEPGHARRRMEGHVFRQVCRHGRRNGVCVCAGGEGGLARHSTTEEMGPHRLDM